VDLADDAALVLFSGGQDSTTCLAWALSRFARVETVAFDYGQRHAVELDCCATVREGLQALSSGWAERLGGHHRIDLRTLNAVAESALTRDQPITTGSGGLPTTFVPGRNLLFFTYAAIIAHQRRLRHLVGGMCETDYSGYPDCRDNTLKALQLALALGMDSPFVIHTPLMWRDKAATWALAKRLGGAALVDLIIEHTHTCYQGERALRQPWGYGCGACPACRLRADGHARFVAAADAAAAGDA
jgi:7-cyano-7-deazaguanine synthase